MPSRLVTAGRDKILQRGIKIAEANLPSWLTEAALSGAYVAKEALAAHIGNLANPHAVTKAQVGLGNVDNTSDAAKPVSTAVTTALAGKSNTGHGHTFADISGILSSAQLPPLAISEPFVVASQAAMLALTAERGDVAIRTDIGRSYILAADAPGTLANWKLLTAAGDVISVAGRTGTVVLAKGDVGLSNVDNTSDANKPVSTAQAAAFVARWKPVVVYTAGDQVIAPNNKLMTARVSHSSSPAFATDAAKWKGGDQILHFSNTGYAWGAGSSWDAGPLSLDVSGAASSLVTPGAAFCTAGGLSGTLRFTETGVYDVIWDHSPNGEAGNAGYRVVTNDSGAPAAWPGPIDFPNGILGAGIHMAGQSFFETKIQALGIRVPLVGLEIRLTGAQTNAVTCVPRVKVIKRSEL